jgi:hypothetical protein
MWRPAHGATSRPGPCRPASGYGRAPGRPGPGSEAAADDEASPVKLDPVLFGEGEAEVPAPVTP